jgi:alpha-L-rhamnosidase
MDRNGLVEFGLGDWVPPFGEANDYTAPVRYSGSGFYYEDAVILCKAAEVLGKSDDATKYAKLAAKIKKGINRLYYDKISGMYAGGSQTALAAALCQDFVEPGQRKKVARQLVAEIKQNKGRINAGIMGTKHVLFALCDMDRSDVAYKIATQTTRPSWGWWIEQGATTLWENWDGASSRNHIMMGSISTWFYEGLAGIRPDPGQPGFKNVIIRPALVKDLDWVKAQHETNYGTVRSSWQRSQGRLTLEVSVPTNTSGTVNIPCTDPNNITEDKVSLASIEGVKDITTEKGMTVFSVGSGSYTFEWPEE